MGDCAGVEVKKVSSYQRLNEQCGQWMDEALGAHEFLSNVEARLMKVRADLQRQNPKAAKRKVAKLLGEIAARLTPVDGEMPF